MKIAQYIFVHAIGLVGFSMRWMLISSGVLVAALVLLDAHSLSGARYWVTVALVGVFYLAGVTMEWTANQILKTMEEGGGK